MVKVYKTISDIVATILIVPFILVVIIILSPLILVLVIITQIEVIKNKSKLRALLKANNNQIFFLYSDYNNFKFIGCFEKRFSEINCINVDHIKHNDLLLNHLINGCGTHAFPRLAKISKGKILSKVHFGSFKHLYKKKNDINTFFDLVEKSIANLNKEEKAGF